MDRRAFLNKAIKLGGLGSILAMGAGCESIDALGTKVTSGQIWPFHQDNSSPQQGSQQQSYSGNVQNNSRQSGILEYTHPIFGRVTAFMALGKIGSGPPDISKGRHQFISISDTVQAGTGDLWFYTEVSGLFGNPQFAIYNRNTGNQVGKNSEVAGVGDKYINSFPRQALSAGDYTGVVLGQRVQTALSARNAKGVGHHMKVSEVNFTVR